MNVPLHSTCKRLAWCFHRDISHRWLSSWEIKFQVCQHFNICFATRRQPADVLWWGEKARAIGYWCALADSSKSVVKEGTFVFRREGYLSTVIDIQQHWTASGCIHPSGANHCALPEKFTLPTALESGCCNSPVHSGWYHFRSNVLAFIFRYIFTINCGILNFIFPTYSLPTLTNH